MKVSELAKELEKTNKEILEFFASKNIEAKAHNSTISDESADLARAFFKGANAKEEKAEAKTKAPKEPKAVSPEKKESAKAVVSDAKPVKEQPSESGREDPSKVVKKKKSIIFVANNNNSGMGGNKPNQQRPQGPRPGQASSRPGANQVQHKIIKPLTAPSSVETTSDFRENARKLDEARSKRHQEERERNNENTRVGHTEPLDQRDQRRK